MPGTYLDLDTSNFMSYVKPLSGYYIMNLMQYKCSVSNCEIIIKKNLINLRKIKPNFIEMS